MVFELCTMCNKICQFYYTFEFTHIKSVRCLGPMTIILTNPLYIKHYLNETTLE